MNKIFTLGAACLLPMLTPVSAHEGAEELAKIQKDRERLIDLVLDLEAEFGKTLQDYTKLQEEYAKLLNRPAVPDQSAKVKALQKQLEAANARITSQPKKTGDANTRALLEQDLVNLRNELHRERRELLVAKAGLIRIKQLEKKNKDLEASLGKETANREKTLGELQAIRGERDALLGRLKNAVARAEKAEKAHAKSNTRIGQLEKAANLLKLDLNRKEVELRKLRVEEAHNQGAMAAAAELKKDQERLTALLGEREKELTNLRKDLAAEMKRSLDVPVLIKARDELQKKLSASTAKTEGLKKENKALTEKQVLLQKEIADVQKSIATMQAEFAKNKEAMTSVTKLGTENKALAAERGRLMKDLATANTSLTKVQDSLKKTEAQLVESKKLSASAAELKKQNENLLKQQVVLKKTLATAKADVGAMQKSINQNQTALKAAVELGTEVKTLKADREKLDKQLADAVAAMNKAQGDLKKSQDSIAKNKEMVANAAKAIAENINLRADLLTGEANLKQALKEVARLEKIYDTLNTTVMALEKEKVTLTNEIEKRGGDLKKLRGEMAKKPGISAEVAKLQQEKDKLVGDLARRDEDLKKTRMELGRLQLSSEIAKKQLLALKRQSARIDPVRYARGEADVTTQQARVLTEVQEVLKLFPKARFEIVGHTCDIGSADVNLRLSRQRAKALHDFLIEKGIPADRLKSRGVGQAEPTVPNTNEANRRQNRRVVVEILD